jgi:hypothetical protein
MDAIGMGAPAKEIILNGEIIVELTRLSTVAGVDRSNEGGLFAFDLGSSGFAAFREERAI